MERANKPLTLGQLKQMNGRPVVRGRWVEKPYLLGTTNVCSVCGENYGMPHRKFKFCPSCGADMRGGEEENEAD